MNILVASDIHNDIENLANNMDKVMMLDFDVLICPGDFTDVPPKGFKAVEIARLILEEFRTLNKPILAVPGNLDGDIVKMLEEEGVSIHGKGRVINGIGFYGFGGAKTPFNTSLEPSDEEMEAGLKKGFDEAKNAKFKVQVTHSPPARTKVDILYTGAHAGSNVIRKFIEENKPIVAISAHIHEARGTDEIDGTKIINAGCFSEGYCGIISIKNGHAETKIVNLI
jgi:hypothetical protein